MRLTASTISPSSSEMTSMRFSWIPSAKQYLAKKEELVSIVYVLRVVMLTFRIQVGWFPGAKSPTHLSTQNLITNDQTRRSVYCLGRIDYRGCCHCGRSATQRGERGRRQGTRCGRSETKCWTRQMAGELRETAKHGRG